MRGELTDPHQQHLRLERLPTTEPNNLKAKAETPELATITNGGQPAVTIPATQKRGFNYIQFTLYSPRFFRGCPFQYSRDGNPFQMSTQRCSRFSPLVDLQVYE